MPKPEDTTGAGAADLIKGEQAGAADLQQAGELNTDAAGQQTSDTEVAAFKAKAEDEVSKRQAVEEENRRLNEQLLMQANPPQTPQTPKDVFEGMEDYETPTVAQIRQSQAESHQNQTEQTNRLLMNIQHQNFIAANPDYSEVVGTVGPTGRLECAEPLKELIKNIPSMRGLANVVATNPAAAQYAYEMAKQHKELKELQAQQSANTEHQAQVNVDNKLAPLSPAAVGGGGGGPTGSEPTDNQVEEAFDRALSGEFG